MKSTQFWSKSPYYTSKIEIHRCKENGLEMLVMDNDPKLHCKAVVVFMKEHGVQIYPGGGTNPWVKSFCFMIFDFMKIVKQMVTLREVMVACPQKLNLQVDLNLRKKM